MSRWVARGVCRNSSARSMSWLSRQARRRDTRSCERRATRRGNELGNLTVEWRRKDMYMGHIFKAIRGLLVVGLGTVATTAVSQEAGSRISVTNLADLSIEQLMEIPIATVYGASKYEQKVTEAPSSISIITADEIKKFGYRTLADVLSSVRGLHVPNDRNYSYLGIRGFLRPGDFNTRVLILIDGHRMNDNIYDGAYLGNDSVIDVDLIERVEVIRGPSSSIYGSSAFFGVVNVVTRRGSQMDGVEVSGEVGSFGTYKERLTLGETFKNGVEWLVSAAHYRSDGQSLLYYPEFDQRISRSPRARNNGEVENRDGEKALDLFTSLRCHDFTFSGAFNGRTKEVPTASNGSIFNDGREELVGYRGYADLRYDHGINDSLRVLGRAFYDNSTYDGSYPINFTPRGELPDAVLYKSYAVGEWAGTEWQLTVKSFDRHTLILGAEYRENIRQDQSSYSDSQPRTYYLDDSRSSRTLGVFAQDEVAVMTNLLFSVGLRYDYYFGSFGGAANPRVGLIYNPWERSTLKALYGQAFRAPNPFESHFFNQQSSMPELDPETIRTYELVCEQYLGRRYRLTVSGYFYKIHDLISPTVTPTFVPYYGNIDKADARGVEFEAEGKYDSGLLARASYALQRTENEHTDEELSSAPRHLAKVNLSLPVYKDVLFISPELQYYGTTRTITGARVDDFLIANLTLLSRRMARNLEISASVYNLADTTYGYPSAENHLQEVIEQDGRSFRVKVTYRF
ncbi:MAG: TonB-dependent receptor [Verrucomicrobia bacterium]|nr:TonB-dependent receptor [Verrucomicrobiota bacterium]